MANLWVNILGYAASCAVLATFLMRTMIPLRLIAILSNVLFLLFGYIQHIYPVFFLHVALLPINTWRLIAVREYTAMAPVFRQISVRGDGLHFTFWFAVGLLAGVAGSLALVLMVTMRFV
jgi:hypothetical protein